MPVASLHSLLVPALPAAVELVPLRARNGWVPRASHAIEVDDPVGFVLVVAH